MPSGVYERKQKRSVREFTCKTCGHQVSGWGPYMLHMAEAHDAGPGGSAARAKAVLSFRGNKMKPTTKSRRMISAPKPAGASYDNSVPWNLGLVDALNMARKSIERSLEIIEGSQPTS